ncbi:hypothetical protein J2Z32_000443 [Paenibacillus turicensis]|uniref:Transglutaminase-like domain-containing protein n=1 Tax=Paenibacillus turicensis TaxID=160487 RepID=A0ABS4FMM9_9BACL|nr:transglutaminase domain-containing protein [Paenibacillus turicensis]MBP1903831.1 hypothetical protein [Paenibacillus turicensis]
MKRLFAIILTVTLVLTGCQSNNLTKAPEKADDVKKGSTILTLKQKYGTVDTKEVMPMYNIAQDEEFKFKFKADLRKSNLTSYDIISVHTDIKAYKASKVYAFSDNIDNTVTVRPMSWGVLASESMKKRGESSWGGAPIYYIRLNYDPDAEQLTLLDKPIIIPFTVKSELPVPNLNYVIDKDRRLSLVWDKVEGATEYKIYQRSKIILRETSNIPLQGAEEAFEGNLPRLQATTTETTFNDFLEPGKGGLGYSDKYITSHQNFGLEGEYYVTAVNGDKESNFSKGIATAPLSKQLPQSIDKQEDNKTYLSNYSDTSMLPSTLNVKFIDGSISSEPVIYDTAEVELKDYGVTVIPFHIKDTALRSYVNVESERVTQDDLDQLAKQSIAAANSGNVLPENNTPYVPSPDVPTIINDGNAPAIEPTEEQEAPAQPETQKSEMESAQPEKSSSEPAASAGEQEPAKSEDSSNSSTESNNNTLNEDTTKEKQDSISDTEPSLVDEQKSNTKYNVEQGNQEIVPEPATGDSMINADSAFEEVLAKNLIAGQREISLKAFPEAQNFTTLEDAFKKVIYQNPLILGVERYQYNYETLTLIVEYSESANEIKRKQEEIISKAKQIVGSIIKQGMSDDEKRKAIYDYLNDNAKYDDAALENAEKNDFKKTDPQFNDSFTTYGIMVKGIGVCASYASTYKLLSDLAGLESIVVTGTASGVPHAWNKVKIGSEWLNVDATNNLTNSGIPYYLYNTNDETARNLNTIADKDYWIDSELDQFRGDSNSNDYYVQHQLEVSSISEYKTKTESELKKGEYQVTLRFASPVNSDELMTATKEVLTQVDETLLDTAQLATLGSYAVLNSKPDQK